MAEYRVVEGRWELASSHQVEKLPALRGERGGYNCRRPANLFLSGEGAPRRVNGASVGGMYAAIQPCPTHARTPVRVTGQYVTVQLDGDFYQGTRPEVAGFIRDLAAAGRPEHGEIAPWDTDMTALLLEAASLIEGIPDHLMVADDRPVVRRPEHNGRRPGVLSD